MRFFLTTVLCCLIFSATAFRHDDNVKPSSKSKTKSFNQDCAQATAQTDLDINNVRARLLVGGDMWWDGTQGQYIVPRVAAGEPEVSSLFAGAIWLGGVDPAGNLKVAAQQYGTANGTSDYWPGPLTESGVTQEQSCLDWDKIFTVMGDEIDLHLIQFAESQADSSDYDISLIPKGVMEWPGIGNPFFFDACGFNLPVASQGLAPFWDEDGDGWYNPQLGDYPIIEIRGCSAPNYADQMQYWIFNDAGNVHTESGGDPLSMEIQGQAFAFNSLDEINNMTFTRYKLINRAQESIENTIFGVWVDPDLGCGEDDYIGCDSTRNLMYVYNKDAIDGDENGVCSDGVPTYGDKVPYLGVDFFRGPLAPKVIGANGELITPDIGQVFDTIVEVGISSFIYFNSASTSPDPNMAEPTTPQEYYNYLSGRWRDGTPLTIGGTGFGGTVETNFAFHDEPDNNQGWSMCTAEIPDGDVRTVQSSGPFRLDPGQVNELIIGVPWVPNVTYPCPDMNRLFRADDIAQGLFNSCFDILDGPDAPDVEWIAQDQKVIGILTNDPVTSNNSRLEYEEVDPLSPSNLTTDERTYKFEGYIVYQLLDQSVGSEELDNPERARIVFQSDIENQAEDIYNWIPVPNPNAGPFDNPNVYIPALQIEGENKGLESTFALTTDLFTGGPLINNETYYYTAIAYGFNEHKAFDPGNLNGQPTPYIEGRHNVRRYSIQPSATPEGQPEYGNRPIVTRLDGLGAGANFLSLSSEERDRLITLQEGTLPAQYNGSIVYKRGGAPVLVKVVDPMSLLEGRYILRFDQNGDLESGQTGWELFNATSNESLGESEQNLENQNEQYFPDLGFSITVGQTPDAGDLANDRNGAIGQAIRYDDPSQSWLTPVPDNANSIDGLENIDLHYLATAPGEINSRLDPTQSFTNFGSGHFAPYTLMDWSLRPNFYATPAWLFPQSNVVQAMNPLDGLNNVDIVLTNDKSKWSRCVVVETGNSYFTDAGIELDDNKANFEVVARPSVGKEDADGDGRPDPDGEGQGLAWFPGYAINVETGVRLNLFFGENSAFGDNSIVGSMLESQNGSDMMFNPSPQAAIAPQPGVEPNPYNLVLGGMHYVYVTRQPYDECKFIKEKLEEAITFRRVDAVELITWAGIGLGSTEVPMLSYAEGLIPTETLVSLRVDNPYGRILGTNDNAAFPSYEFGIDSETITSTASPAIEDERLARINVYPNPIISSSDARGNNFSAVAKIANIPSQSIVTIYTMNGVYVKQFKVDGNAAAEQGTTLEWDLRNASGAFVSSGAYLIHVQSKGIGERVLKLICIK